MNQCFGDNHYFALLGVPVDFVVDKVQLKQNLLALQKQYHPDQFKDNGKQSDLINHAYAALENDAKRAIYLLELAGVGLNLDQSIGDLDFLDLMMDSRITLSESDDATAIHQVKIELDNQYQALGNHFAQAYEQKNWANASDAALKLKFIAKLYDDFKAVFNQVQPSVQSDDDWLV